MSNFVVSMVCNFQTKTQNGCFIMMLWILQSESEIPLSMPCSVHPLPSHAPVAARSIMWWISSSCKSMILFADYTPSGYLT